MSPSIVKLGSPAIAPLLKRGAASGKHMRMRRVLIILLAPLLLTGCFTSVFALDEKIVGPWRLMETDTAQDRAICRSDVGEGCETAIDAMVYAAGWDSRYIVAARHPLIETGRPDMAKSEYYYIPRSPDESKPTWRAVIQGPFSEAQFKSETVRLKLPPLTIWPDR
jgi:hypothetical protein